MFEMVTKFLVLASITARIGKPPERLDGIDKLITFAPFQHQQHMSVVWANVTKLLSNPFRNS